MKELIRKILRETIKNNKVICDGCGHGNEQKKIG